VPAGVWPGRGLCWLVAQGGLPGRWGGPGSLSRNTAETVSLSALSRSLWSLPRQCGGPLGDRSVLASSRPCVPCSVPRRWGYRWCSPGSG
jgi:hypothetical protein